MEIKILAAAITSRVHWNTVSPHITDEDLTPEGILVWDVIADYYDRDEAATHVDMELLSQRVLRRVKDNAKHGELLDIYLTRIASEDSSAVNVVSEVLDYKKAILRTHLVDALTVNNEARSTELMDRLQALDFAYDLDLGVDDEYSGVDIDTLLEGTTNANLIRVAPPSLNRRLGGGALRGHHIIVAARPEVGKSLVVLHMAHGFVQQNLKVLHIGNEDPTVGLVLRFVSNLTGHTRAQMISNREETMRIARERNYDLATFIGLSPGSIPEIRSLIHKHTPDVLIVDQLRNLTAGKSENRTVQLETVARGIRDLARQYKLLAISVTQAADSATNKLRLDMGDIDSSNTGIPGACDAMVMVGMNEMYYNNGERQLTLAKNKLGGVHESWPIRVDITRSRIVDTSGIGMQRGEV